MVLLELFISFLKIGFTSFGGVSMVPLINSEMLSHGWMSAQEVSDIVEITFYFTIFNIIFYITDFHNSSHRVVWQTVPVILSIDQSIFP